MRVRNPAIKTGVFMSKCIVCLVLSLSFSLWFSPAAGQDTPHEVGMIRPGYAMPGGTTWGEAGSEEGQFKGPTGMAVDAAGRLYIADTGNDRIQVFNKRGRFIAAWGSAGKEEGNFGSPGDVAVDPAGNVYVVDPENFRIQKFDAEGDFLAAWGPDKVLGAGFIREPVGIAVDAAGTVYVADAWQALILKYDDSGNFITAWGDTIDENGGMFSFRPTDLALDAAGNVFATDYYNNRVLKFDATGALITSWGIKGSGAGEFSYPSGIAVDANGNVYVADTFNHRIQQFDNDGTFIAEWGAEGDGYGSFNLPFGIAANSSGTVYVADTFNNRIQLFDFSASPCIFSSILGKTDVHTEQMRDFRERFLATSVPGRRVIELYGTASAMMQPLLDKSPLARKLARAALTSAAAVLASMIP